MKYEHSYNNGKYIKIKYQGYEDLPACIDLTKKYGCIDLSCNKIKKIRDMNIFKVTKEICLHDNLLTKLNFEEKNENLTRIDLRHNRIDEINGIENLVNLEVIRLQGNPIKKVLNLNKLSKLKEINLPNIHFLYLNKIFYYTKNVAIGGFKLVFEEDYINDMIWEEIKDIPEQDINFKKIINKYKKVLKLIK